MDEHAPGSGEITSTTASSARFDWSNWKLQLQILKTWDDYVGLRDAEIKDFCTVPKKTPSEVVQSYCDIVSTSSVHMVTNKVGLSDQVLCAGRITVDWLECLRVMIKEMEDY